MADPDRIITADQMRQIDARAAKRLGASWPLMLAAGRAVAEDMIRHVPAGRRIWVLAGYGNNGGDGLVAAGFLQDHGYDVRICALDYDRLQAAGGDCARARTGWNKKPILTMDAFDPVAGDFVLDALFGAGFTGNLPDVVIPVVKKCRDLNLRVWAVDLPSGVLGNDGIIPGMAFQAYRTITFECLKPGHILYPGRAACGKLSVQPIGWQPQDFVDIPPDYRLNHPVLFADCDRLPVWQDHKYTRGYVLVYGGVMEGAACLAARAAARTGAGYVGLYQSRQYHHAVPDAVVVYHGGIDHWENLLADKRIDAVVFGPGCGVSDETERALFALLNQRIPCVLDGDAFSLLAGDAALRAMLGPHCVLTPHAAELTRIAHDIAPDGVDRLDLLPRLCRQLNVTLVAKGADTIIVSPGMQPVFDGQGDHRLSTAGTGDVLSGMIAGYIARGATAHQAACHGVWAHGRVAQSIPGNFFVADDLIDNIRDIL